MGHLSMRTLAILGLCLASLGWSSWARAATPGDESRARAAQRACLMGDPGKGVELLTDLYLDTRDPTHIYNQGRCFEMNRRYEEAIGRFREYMVKAKNLTEEEKADTEKHIKACQSYRATPDAKPSQPPAAASQPPSAAPAEPAVAQGGLATGTVETPRPAPVATIQQPPVPPAHHPGAALRTAGLVTGAIGVAALAAGVLLNLKVNSMSSDLEQRYNYSPAVDSRRKDYKTAAWLSYGVGAAGLAGGALLYFFGWRKGSGTLVGPAVAPGMAGAFAAGIF